MNSIDDAIRVLMGNSDMSFESLMVIINKELKKYSSRK